MALLISTRISPLQTRRFCVSLCFHLLLKLASTDCPNGVRPGEHYPNPDKIWQIGVGAAGRCDTKQGWGFPSTTDDKCADWFAPGVQGKVVNKFGEQQGKCVYNEQEHGGYWCALSSSTNASCVVTHENADGKACIDSDECIEQANYGICWCEQCPCPLEGQYGKDCDICTSGDDCNAECVYNKGIFPGQKFRCDFGDDFLKGGGYSLLWIGYVAQPKIEVDVILNGFVLRVLWSYCTFMEQLMLTATFQDCKTGTFSQCQAQGIPDPCYKCEEGVSVVYPEGGFLPDSSKAIIDLVGTGGTMFGCRSFGDDLRMECTIYYDAFPLDWGWFRCVLGTECVGGGGINGSSNASAVNATTVYSDPKADPAFVWYLITGSVISLLVCVAIICFGARYTFKTAGVALDIDGLQLEWDNLSVGDIISNLKGCVGPGALVAVLGPIGAGKSTLLKTLCGRLPASSGTVYVNRKPMRDFELRKVIGFVPQEDICCPDDTVAEAIAFAAAMSNGRFPELHFVLRDKLNERISNLSGGQRRMANVYVELARLPQILLLDEPTTGLDSYSARELMMVLKEVSKSIPVLATMHQPGPDVADFLDEVFILADGEEVCHAGSATHKKKAIPELQALIEKSGRKPHAEGLYALDVAIDLAYEGVKLGSTVGAPQELVTVEPVTVHGNSGKSLASGASETKLILKKICEMPRQLFYLGIRNIKRALRRNMKNYVVTAFGALVIGFCYIQADNTLNGVRMRFGAIFMTHAFLALQAVGATSVTRPVATLTEHEIDSYVYLRAVDALGKVLGQLFGQIPHGLIVSLIVYSMVGLRQDGSRPVVFCICMITCAVANGYTALLARQRNQTYVGMIRACTANGLMLFFCGFLLGNEDVPFLIAWGKEVSPARYSYEMLLAHELIGLRTIFNPVDADAIPTRGGIYLQQYGLVHKIDDEFYALGYKLGWLTAIWASAAFVVLMLPSTVCCECRRFRPVRLKGEGQLDILLKWLENQVMPEALKANSAEDITLIGVKEMNEESSDVAGNESGSSAVSEIFWDGIGNADTSNLCGGLRTGTLLGIVGPCGSGKSTLLTMLTGRVSCSSGKIVIGGKAATHRQLAANVGYVPQVNNLFEEDTLKEALEFASKASRHTTLAKVAAGNQGEQRIRQLSGGQQRVAAVAVELARRPCLLALDEPLSGLDGASSMKMANLLKRISRVMPVIITMHQPRPEVACLLSHVMIMHHGKLCVSLPYTALSLPDVAATIEKAHQYSPPDLPVPTEREKVKEPKASVTPYSEDFMEHEVSHNGSNGRDEDGTESSQENQLLRKNGGDHTWADSQALRPLDRILATIEEFWNAPKLSDYKPTKAPAMLISRRHDMSFRLFRAVLGREIRRLWLQKPFRVVGVFMFWAAAGLLCGMAYSEMEGATTLGVLQRCGLFFALNSAIIVVTLPRVFFFFEVRKTVMHELESQIINPFLYHVCQSLADFTLRLPCAFLFCIAVVVLVPFQEDQEYRDGGKYPDGKYVILVLTVMSTAMSCACLADAITAFSRDHLQASSAYAGITIVMTLFAASFVAVDSRQVINDNQKTHADTVSTLTHCSMFYYSWQALIENDLRGAKFDFIINGVKTTTLTGEVWLQQLDVPERMVGNIMIVLAFGVFFWILAGFGLIYQTFPRRRSALPV